MTALPESGSRPRAALVRVVAYGLVLGALLACAAEIGWMIVQRNAHVVVPGRSYRTGQLTPTQLADFVHRYDVRTVVNLRGRPFDPWYAAECQTTHGLGISQEDITMSANRLPSPGELQRLIEVFDRSEHPIVIHCQQGADRTGLASAVYQLLYSDAPYEAARRQCSPRFGHLPIHTAAAMDEFFDRYEAWLAAHGESHSPAVFRRWATQEYSPGPNKGWLEVISPTGPMASLFAGAWLEVIWPSGPMDTDKPVVFTVRAHNTSAEPWQLKAGSQAGICAWYVVQQPSGSQAFDKGNWAGFFDHTVPPGGFVDLQLPVPALKTPGRYRLYVDLMKRNVSFTQYGSEALIYDWDARDAAPPGGD